MEVEIYKMLYKITKSTDNLRILGETYVKNNKNKGKFIIRNKRERIKSILSIKNLKQNKIKMVISKNIYNINSMFKDCELLENFSFKNLDNITDNMDDMQMIGGGISNLANKMKKNINKSESTYSDHYFSDISEITIKKEKIEDSLLFLQYLTKRNIFIKYYINMSYMFSNCNSLKSIPNIFLWEMNSSGTMIDMSYMFYNCNSLISLPIYLNGKQIKLLI